MIKLDNKKWIGNQITQEEINKWSSDKIITIQAGMGKGKSHFIKNNLYAKAVKENRKILMLIHRLDCINQFRLEIKKENKQETIDVRTYQSIESVVKKNEVYDFSQYSYIVCDEFHYFMGDAGFNMTTDISLNQILDQDDKIRIFMSATGDNVIKYINNVKNIDTIDYAMDIDYDFIEELNFFNKDETMNKFVEECLERKSKAIFFIRSAKKAYQLYKKYAKHCLFNCSASNDEYYKYVDQDKINKMLENEKFEESILITTTTMEAGVNIKDDKVKHIICDVEDLGSMIQCIGRRRIKNDKICLYIKNVNNNQLGNRVSNLKQAIKMADYRKEHGNDKYVSKYGREYSNIVYLKNIDGKTETVVNELAFFKRKIDICISQMMISKGYRGYMDYITFDLFKLDRYIIVEEEYEKKSLESYLDSIVGEVMLMSQDRKEIIGRINVKSNGKQLKSLDSLNSALREQNLNFYINQFQTSRMVSGKKKNFKSAWRVLRLIDK